MSGMRERAARMLYEGRGADYFWVDADEPTRVHWLSRAADALAVAADVDEIAAVLAGHRFLSAGSEDGYRGVCAHEHLTCRDDPTFTREAHERHQAEMVAAYILDQQP